ncbi:CotH kinase family protein [Elizabethkingia anophelis]|uniref:CotH kinase family protein n=1 Tax=Elizabethkingia anophelis TaxID=1117645 RepID=UPI002011E1CE|nr:CotH kinase family protein [Elizabethkingia anophelis]MCL1690832.1 CotH kinase family protein [Elizabethkingia anophelis]
MNILQYIFSLLPDNSSKKITAKDVRDAFAEMDKKVDLIDLGLSGDAELNTQPSTTKLERWNAPLVGTYVNFRDSNGNPITVTKEELDEFDVILSVSDGVTKKVFSKKKDPKTNDWEPKSYQIDVLVYRFGKVYKSRENTSASDIPGESDKWKDLEAENFITDGFSKRGAKEVDLLLHKSPIPGAYKIDNTTLVESTVASTFHNIDIEDYDYLWIDFIPVYLEASLKSEVKAIIGIKENGIIEVLEESYIPTNWWGIENQKRKAYDVRPYKYITINYQSNIAYSNMFRLVKGEINIKQYSDEARIAMSSFLGGLVDLSSPKYEYKKVTATNTPSVNGVSVLDQYLIGTDNGIMGPVSNDWGKFKTWYNIPMNNKEEKLRITEIVFNTGRIGGDYPSMVAVDAKGKITVLVPSQVPPLNKADNYVIDVTGYEFVSLVMNISTPELEAASYFTFNAKRYFESTDDIIKKYIDGKVSDVKLSGKITDATLVSVNRPNTLPVVNIIGDLPTDTSEVETPTNVVLEYSVDNTLVFSCKSDLAIQGGATKLMAKQGYETKCKNFSDKKLNIQFGGWLPTNSFHLKAFPHDRTFSRDVVSSKVWHRIRTSRPFPSSYIADFGNTNPDGSALINTMESALFYADGFPIELRHNGIFRGIYVWRLKKENRNYMFDETNPNHIFLDNELLIDWSQYVAAQWKIRSPKTKNQALTDKLVRLFNWFKGITDGTIDFESTYSQYINIDSWVDWLMSQQVCTLWDTQIHNMQLHSWSGNTFSLGFYDADMGWFWATEGGVDDPPLIIDAQGLYWRGTFFRNVIYPKLKSRIQQRWTELRNKNIITTDYIYMLFKNMNGVIPSELLKADFEKWSEIPYGRANRQSVRYIMSLVGDRLNQLDQAWKL